jgi:hypothetical protein
MNALLDRVRGFWDGLNDRERRLVGAMLAMLVALVLGFPLFWTAHQNGGIEEENLALREALELISEHRDELRLLAETRRTSAARYRNRTPSLGSFLEGEAKKHDLTIREVTDQPEKAFGNYHRRSVSASTNEAGLTPIVNMLSGIVSSPYPVAIEHIQLEHYQPGDTYRFKLGVLTFDQKAASKASSAGAKAPSEG